MDTIKLLNKTKNGMYVAIILNNGIRCPSLYMGQPTSGVYQFIIDDTGVYRMTAGYIKSHNIKIDQTLNSEELFQIGVIVNQVMKKEVK